MLEATCHCGDVRVRVPAPPEKLVNCNCSICRRLGALWAHYQREDVEFDGHPDRTEGYVWGNRTLDTRRCRRCGCVTHWEPLHGQTETRVGVNMRNFDPEDVGPARIRRFDGAVSWTYLDE